MKSNINISIKPYIRKRDISKSLKPKRKAAPAWENYQTEVSKHFERAKKNIEDAREALNEAIERVKKDR